MTTKLLVLLLCFLSLVTPVRAACNVANNADFHIDWTTQDQLEHYGDQSLSLWVRITGGTTQPNSIVFAHGGNGETEATNYMFFVGTNASNTGFRWLWENGAGANTNIEVTGTELGTFGNLPSDTWMYFGFTRDVSETDVYVYVYVLGATTHPSNGQPPEQWFTKTVNYTNNPSGGSSGTTHSFVDATGNQADTIAAYNIRVYNSALSEKDHRTLVTVGNLAHTDAVLHIPLNNCFDNIHFGTRGDVTYSGSFSYALREPNPSLLGIFK